MSVLTGDSVTSADLHQLKSIIKKFDLPVLADELTW